MRIGILAVAVAATLIACSDGDDDSSAPRRELAPLAPADELEQAGYEVIDVGDAGSIAGSVRWEGPLPELAMLPVRAHREVCGEEQPSAALTVGEGGGVAGAVVTHNERLASALPRRLRLDRGQLA